MDIVEFIERPDIWFKEISALFVIIWPAFLVGLFIGGGCGFFAPDREPKNIFRSPFCRRVVADTFKFWLPIQFLALLCVTFVSICFEPWLINFDFWTPSYVVTFLLFFLSLWGAVNRALSATKLK